MVTMATRTVITCVHVCQGKGAEGIRTMMRDGEGTPLRLLPWTTPEGAPCYLSTDDPDSRLSRLADEMEDGLLASAEQMLVDIRSSSIASGAPLQELRHAVTHLTGALRDVLRVATSRGTRLPGADAGRPL